MQSIYAITHLFFLLMVAVAYVHLVGWTRQYGENLSRLCTLSKDTLDAYCNVGEKRAPPHPFNALILDRECKTLLWSSEEWSSPDQIIRCVDGIQEDTLHFDHFPDLEFKSNVTVFYKTKRECAVCVVYLPTS